MKATFYLCISATGLKVYVDRLKAFKKCRRYNWPCYEFKVRS